MSHDQKIFHADGPVRRGWPTVVAGIGAAVIMLLLIIVPIVTRAIYGTASDTAEAILIFLAFGVIIVGLVCFVFAVIGLIKDRGTPRIGAGLLVVCGLIQVIFGIIGTTSTTMNTRYDTLYNWAWGGISSVVVILGCTFVFAPPRPLTHRTSPETASSAAMKKRPTKRR